VAKYHLNLALIFPFRVPHGFKRHVLAGLVQRNLAAAAREVAMAGGKAIEVVRLRITAAGREGDQRRIAGRAAPWSCCPAALTASTRRCYSPTALPASC
jgi:hypothetical protein